MEILSVLFTLFGQAVNVATSGSAVAQNQR